MKKHLISLFFISAGLSNIWGAMDPYDAMDFILGADQQPRLLNTNDLPEGSSNTPESLFSPEGDFNADGSTDVAVSGIYNLPKSNMRYFLLVFTQPDKTHQYQKLFYRGYPSPVFIHQSGTTGEGDPGDQSFSISFCWECDQGNDFYWNKVSQEFETRPWKAQTKRIQKMVVVPAEQISEEVVDRSLKIVGDLPDVQTYVANLKKEGRILGTKVEWDERHKERNRTVVSVFEKKEGKENFYDKLTVDLKENKVIKRTLRIPTSPPKSKGSNNP